MHNIREERKAVQGTREQERGQGWLPEETAVEENPASAEGGDTRGHWEEESSGQRTRLVQRL